MNEIYANIDNMNEGEITCPDIKSPAIMVKCEHKKHKDKNDNETETSLVTLDKVTEKWPDIRSPDMI